MSRLFALIDEGLSLPLLPGEAAAQAWVARASRRALAPLTVANWLLADEAFLFLVVFPVLFWVVGPPALAVVAACLVSSTKVEAKMKAWFRRPRPRSIYHLDTTDYGIPSGDAMLVAAWTPLAFGWWAALPIAAVWWARLARDAHYPLDVLLGSAVGLGLASAGLYWR